MGNESGNGIYSNKVESLTIVNGSLIGKGC